MSKIRIVNSRPGATDTAYSINGGALSYLGSGATGVYDIPETLTATDEVVVIPIKGIKKRPLSDQYKTTGPKAPAFTELPGLNGIIAPDGTFTLDPGKSDGQPLPDVTLTLTVNGTDVSGDIVDGQYTATGAAEGDDIELTVGRSNVIGTATPETVTCKLLAPGTGQATTKIQDRGGIYYMPGAREYGEDVAGDKWIFNPDAAPIGAARLITPESQTNFSGTFEAGNGTFTGRTIHGTMINPGSADLVGTDLSAEAAYFGNAQGWDTTPNNSAEGTVPFDAARNEDPSANGGAILSLEEGTIWKSIGKENNVDYPNGISAIDTFSLLTVTKTKPAADAILGHPWTTAQAIQYRKSDINTSILPRHAFPEWYDLQSMPALIEMMKHPRQWHYCNYNEARRIHPNIPNDDGNGYGGQSGYGRRTGEVLAALCFAHPEDQLLELSALVCREGIAEFRRIETGGTFLADGALNTGRLGMMVMTALLLNDADMLAVIDRTGDAEGAFSNIFKFAEYGNIFTVGISDVYEPIEFDLENGLITGSSVDYVAGDIVRTTGDPSLSGGHAEWEIDTVDGAGQVTGYSLIRKDWFFSNPTGIVNVSGSGTGTGLAFDLGDRPRRIYHWGLVGQVEYAGAYRNDNAGTGANASIRDVYRRPNITATSSALTALHNVTGALTAMNAGEVFDYHDRARWLPGNSLAAEDLTGFEKNFYDTFRGYVDPAPGAPTIVEFGARQGVVWIKYNKSLLEGEDARPANIPEKADFDLQVNGSSAAIREVVVIGSVVTLTLMENLVDGDTLTLAYTKGAAPKVIQDWFGNEAASFTATSVTNSTTTYTNPVPNSILRNASMVPTDGGWGANLSALRYDDTGTPVQRFPSFMQLGNEENSVIETVTGGADYLFSADIINISGPPVEVRLWLDWFTPGGVVEASWNGQPFFADFGVTISTGDEFTEKTMTAPADATGVRVSIRKDSGTTLDLNWVNLELAP